MDSFEVNKIIGALLASILLVLVIGIVGNSLYRVEVPEEPVYRVAVTEGEEAAPSGEAAAEDEATTPGTPEESGGEGAAGGGASALAGLLAAADPAAGKKVAKKCAACHSFDKGGKNKVGPNLWDIVDAPKAGREGYAYSGALKSAGGEWSYDDLDAFLAGPKNFVPGTKMGFAGLKKPEARAAIIAFLRSLSDDPKPLP